MKLLNLKSLALTLAIFCAAMVTHAQSVHLSQVTYNYNESGNSIACGYTPASLSTAANSYYRVFKLSDYVSASYFYVDSVEFGIELASSISGQQMVHINIYSLSGTAVTAANMTLLASQAVIVSDLTDVIGTIPVSTSIAGTGTIVVEIVSEDGTTNGNRFYIGSNPYGQSKPSYWRSDSCQNSIVDLSTIGLSNPMHLVIGMYGRGSSVAPPSMPGAFTSAPTPVCDNTTGLTYTVPAVTGITYQWDYSGSGMSITGATPSGNSITVDFAPGATSGILSVVATNANGSSAARTIQIITVPGVATPDVIKTNDVLSTSVTGSSYTWYLNNTVIPGATNSTYSPTTGGFYAVKVSNGTCSAMSDSFEVASGLDSFIIKTNPVCVAATGNTSVTYSVPQPAAASYYDWMYSGVGVIINSGLSSTVSLDFSPVATSGVLTVRYYWLGLNGFESSLPLNMNITVNPAPAPIFSRAGNVLTAPAGFTSYQWYRNTLAITGATSAAYTMTQNGSYYVKVISTNGCEGKSPEIAISDVTAIDDVNKTKLTFDVYPNPAKEIVNIHTSDLKLLHTKVILTDAYGRVVREVMMNSKSQVLSLAGLSNGIYILKMQNAQALKIIKE